MDQSAILKFIGSLGTDTKTEKSFSSMKKSLDEIYKIKQNELKDDEKDWEREKKEAKQKERDAKRKDADKGNQKGLLSQVIGKDTKKESNNLSALLLAGLGVGGLLAFNYKDEISDFVSGMVEDIKSEVQTAISDLSKQLFDWAGKQAKDYLWDPMKAAIDDTIVTPIGENIIQPLQRMVGGRGTTASGIQFEYGDLVHFANKQQQFFAQKGITGAGADEVNQVYGDIQGRLKSEKGMNDQLFRVNERIASIEGPQTTMVKSREAYPNELKELKKESKNLGINRAQNQKIIAKLWKKTGVTDNDLLAHQRASGRLDDNGVLKRQTGGTVDNNSTNKPPSGKEIDERMFSTTDYEDGASIARRPSKEQRLHLQTGGLVLFQGHGDVPAGHSAPGTDGPGTAIQGKYKPTAEQHFVDKVARKTELLAQKENVPIKYQRSTGKYAQASHPKSNWSLANGIRRKGGSAMELHFDAWGMQNGRMIEGARGILKGSRNLSKTEKSVQNKFGTHPMSGQGWGTLMLELDSLKYAKTRIDAYPRMLVDAVKNSGAKGSTQSTQSGLPNANSFFSQYDAALTSTTPPTTTPTTTPTPTPQPTTPSFTMPDIGGMMSSVSAGMGAFMQGFKDGFSSTFKNPFANAEKHQNGGVVGRKQSKLTTRMQQANSGFLQGSGNIVARPVVVVKRKSGVVPMSSGGSSAPASGGGGLNMVDAAAAIHRLTSGSKF